MGRTVAAHGPISPTLQKQLLQVEPSADGMMEYRLCGVALRDGRTVDRVYIQEARASIQGLGRLAGG